MHKNVQFHVFGAYMTLHCPCWLREQAGWAWAKTVD